MPPRRTSWPHRLESRGVVERDPGDGIAVLIRGDGRARQPPDAREEHTKETQQRGPHIHLGVHVRRGLPPTHPPTSYVSRDGADRWARDSPGTCLDCRTFVRRTFSEPRRSLPAVVRPPYRVRVLYACGSCVHRRTRTLDTRRRPPGRRSSVPQSSECLRVLTCDDGRWQIEQS